MRKERTCLNQVVVYDPIINEMSVKYPHHVPDKMLIPRKYFAGVFMGHSFYCLGGIDTSGKILDSFVKVDLDTMRWEDVLVWGK